MPSEEVQDLTDRVFLLRENLEQGRIKIAEHLRDEFCSSLGKIRFDADGMVRPETVDGQIRAMTAGLRYFRYREEAKKSTTLAQIQERYFRILDANFGPIYKQMVAADADPNIAGHIMARELAFVTHFAENITGLISDLEEFWHVVGEAVQFHIEDLPSLKAVFGGDIFPSFSRNIASTAGLYVDTIVLPCPIMQSAKLVQIWRPEKAAYFVVKHALTAMSYKDLALADVTPPIVIVLPTLEILDAYHVDAVETFSQNATVRYASHLFGMTFESVEEVSEFFSHLPTPDDVLAHLKHPRRLLFDTAWPGSPKEQLQQFLDNNAEAYAGEIGERHAGHAVLVHCVGRMFQAAAIELRSQRLRGTPLIDVETSWQYLNWKMQYDAAVTSEPIHSAETMHIVRALQAEAENNLYWLGNVPVPSVIEIRKRGLAEEVRTILSKGVTQLVDANPSNFFRTGDQVVENLNQAFRTHQKTLVDARDKKLKLFGLDVPACLAVGVISVAAAITANPMLGAMAGTLGIAGLPNFREINTKYKLLREQEQKARTSPTGILFRHLR